MIQRASVSGKVFAGIPQENLVFCEPLVHCPSILHSQEPSDLGSTEFFRAVPLDGQRFERSAVEVCAPCGTQCLLLIVGDVQADGHGEDR